MSSKNDKTYLLPSSMFNAAALEKSIKAGHTQVVERSGPYAVVQLSHADLRKAATNGALNQSAHRR